MTLEHRSNISKIISYSLLTLIAVAFLFPFAWMLASSLKPTSEVFSSGASFTGSRLAWDNYTEATRQTPLGRIILNSILVSTCGALLTMTVSLLSAYAFTRLRFRFRDHLFILFLGTLVLPQEVLVIPLYIGFQHLGLVNSYTALILPFAFGAFGAFLIRQFILSLPLEFEEAARIDGAGDLKILWHILIPLLKAPVLVVGVFSFIDYWSAFLWPLIVVNDADLATIPLGLQMFSGERGTDWGPMMAAVSMSVIPSFFIVAFLQSQLEKGVTLGAFGGR
ncbi:MULTISPECIES: carbohydrate ABC transporter permease [Actinomyces]|uniref:Carbohydrate ABC transporter permease n=1 Tax=Actinomyces respiraculi TaxID=2744574 RepID=A0A7T0LJC1_9ACTO|nr:MULTISPECIES: carbohydrate ABC transporter permease [Actinomyces]QPL04695.1 carbohydrate ABC transporter permease [Actinomyces respiraculi]